jgi:hypothetical protein
MRALCCIVMMVASSPVFAQTTGTVNPSVAPSEPSEKEDAPPGGCMPIGLTASGEIVFPFQCKGFIERHREKAGGEKAVQENPPTSEANSTEQKPAAVEENPRVEQSAAGKRDNFQSIDGKGETGSSPKRDSYKRRLRSVGSEGCQRYRTYDSESSTYRGYDGRRHSC